MRQPKTLVRLGRFHGNLPKTLIDFISSAHWPEVNNPEPECLGKLPKERIPFVEQRQRSAARRHLAGNNPRLSVGLCRFCPLLP